MRAYLSIVIADLLTALGFPNVALCEILQHFLQDTNDRATGTSEIKKGLLTTTTWLTLILCSVGIILNISQ